MPLQLLIIVFFLILRFDLYCVGVGDHVNCDFEDDKCEWLFTNSAELQKIIIDQRFRDFSATDDTLVVSSKEVVSENVENRNFAIVSGENGNHYAYFAPKKNNAGKHESTASMIVSPFFEHMDPKCELNFQYQILGDHKADLLITTEHLSLFATSKFYHHNEITADFNFNLSSIQHEDDDEWIRPTSLAQLLPTSGKQWIKARTLIGSFNYPSRIRIECHLSGKSKPTRSGEVNTECLIDDINLINCNEEVWQKDTCLSTKSNIRFACSSNIDAEPDLCLRHEDLCDLHADCANGEDENDDFHNCSMIPRGARCNFDDSRYPICENWHSYSSFTNSSSGSYQSHLAQLTSFASVQNRAQHVGLPPEVYKFHGKTYHPERFLFFSSYDHHASSEHEIWYTYVQSSFFSPSSLRDQLEKLPPCLLRFFYCRTGAPHFQVFLIAKDSPHESKPLWTLPKDEHATELCQWQRAVAPIKPALLQRDSKLSSDFAIRLSFAKIAGSLGSIAVDDVVLSPSCFAAADNSTFPPQKRFLPEKLVLSSCGNIGVEEPKEVACSTLNKEYEALSIFATPSRWRIPATQEYRVEVYGASGGIMPGQTINNSGGAILANLMLQAGSELSLIVGQRGLCPCDDSYQPFVSPAHLGKWKRICAELSHMNGTATTNDANNNQQLLDSVEILGCGGGGASVLFIDGNPSIIAGGGGGSFVLDNSGKNMRHYAKGGEEQDVFLTSESSHVSGNGASFFARTAIEEAVAVDEKTCDDCDVMSGRVLQNGSVVVVKAGICPSSRQWNIAGGYGGGGASCGPGAGGGGGYHGGLGIYMGFGYGGSNAFLSDSGAYVSKSGFNPGNGRILIFTCPQNECPSNSVCRFEKPDLELSSFAYCQCREGQRVSLNASHCSSSIVKKYLGGGSNDSDVLIPCIVVSLFAAGIVLFCILRILYCQNKQDKSNIHELLDIVETDSTLTRPWIGNKISGNPIYEAVQFSSLQVLDLPCIARHALMLGKVIGHGAFGEVYEGVLTHGDGSVTKVAVKTLLSDASRGEENNDFETEARLLSQFKHRNICHFYGVSFKQQPKYIVLELLEGGDLKNFLRENRPKNELVAGANSSRVNLQMADLILMALDVAQACEHLEATKFVHRDIAARNCLLTSKVDSVTSPFVPRIVKIADFGMARDIYRNDYYRKGGKAFLPVRWMPPESFLDGIFTSKTDVWAFGVLLWEIFSMGYVPYSGRENHEVMKLVVDGDRLEPPIGVPPEIYDMMLCCWHTIAGKRPSFISIVAFLRSILKRQDIMTAPLPPVRHCLLEGSTLSSTNIHPADLSQLSTHSTPATETTALSTDASAATTTTDQGTGGSATSCRGNGSFASYDSMPTAGTGVSRNVFPPYQTQLADPLMRMDVQRGDSSSSSQDDSTLHESATSVRLNHCSIKKPSLIRQTPTTAHPDMFPKRSLPRPVSTENRNLYSSRAVLTPPITIALNSKERNSSLPASLNHHFQNGQLLDANNNISRGITKTVKMNDLNAYKSVEFATPQ